MGKTIFPPEARNVIQRREFWETHLSAWRNGKLSMAEYCRQNHLNEKTLGAWKKKEQVKQDSVSGEIGSKLRASKPYAKKPGSSDGTSLVQVPVHVLSGKPLQSEPLVVGVCGNRFHISIAGDFSALILTKVITTLEAFSRGS